MKYSIIVILLVLITTLFLMACKSKKSIGAAESEIASPIVSISTSTCFGKCKVYKLQILTDRSVTYEGIKNVDNIGTFKSTINDEEYQSLITLFEDANFQNLEPTYLTGVRDKQRFTLGYKQKEVQYQNRAASEQLKSITKKIETIIEQVTWTKK